MADEGGQGPERELAAFERRLAALEDRLTALESRLTAPESRTAAPEGRLPAPTPERAAPDRSPLPPRPPVVEPAPRSQRPPLAATPLDALGHAPGGAGISAALVLGWAGAAALVLAAAYLVRLGIEVGWITPARQVLAVAALGLVMTGAGLALRLGDRPYASLLGAGGIAVLYLAVFGAHLYHHLIGAPVATALAVAVALLSLGLHALYRSGIYVAFALAGSYATPLLVEGTGTVGDLALYLAVWDLLYCAYGIWTGRRIVVIAALYASLIVFDLAWTQVGREAWEAAALFQLFQFVLFVGVAVALSVRLRRPLSRATAVLHYPALLLFYVLEYAILDRHVPALAPWAGLAFVAALYAAWALARGLLAETPRASLVTIHGFGAFVVVHAMFVDVTPERWMPLVALAIAALLVVAPRVRPALAPGWWPYHVAAGILFALGWLILFVEWGSADGPVAGTALALAYPAAMYALYFGIAPYTDGALRVLVLGVAHVLVLISCALLVEQWVGEPDSTVERLWLSLAWAAVGVATLLLAFRRGDHLLARSSLGIFLLFGFKVVAIDLEEAAPLVRIGCLAVLGVSLYAGGWLYRRILPPAASL